MSLSSLLLARLLIHPGRAERDTLGINTHGRLVLTHDANLIAYEMEREILCPGWRGPSPRFSDLFRANNWPSIRIYQSEKCVEAPPRLSVQSPVATFS